MIRAPRFARTAGLKALPALLILALATAGCGTDRAGAQRLVEVGFLSAKTLADYYESLVQDTVDVLEIETFVAGLRNRSIEPLQRLLEEQINALGARSRFAQRLASTYTAVQELAAVDAQADVEREVGNLVGALMRIPRLPESAVDPTSLIAPIAGELAAWRQSRDIRRGAQLVQSALERFARLFEREMEAYNSIAQQRANDIVILVDLVISERNVVLPRSMARMVDALDLDLRSLPREPEPPGGFSSVNAFRQVARVRVYRLALASASAAQGISRALLLTVDFHRAFVNGQNPSPAAVRAAWREAQSVVEQLKRPS